MSSDQPVLADLGCREVTAAEGNMTSVGDLTEVHPGRQKWFGKTYSYCEGNVFEASVCFPGSSPVHFG